MAQRKTRPLFTVVGLLMDNGETYRPVVTLAGDCQHLICDDGEAGQVVFIRESRDWQTAREEAMDMWDLHVKGDLVGETHVEVVATTRQPLGGWGRRQAARRLNPSAAPLQII